MAELSAMDTVRAADKIIHDIGSTWMLDKETWEHGKRNGYANPFAHYFAGRCGVLGDVDADVVYAVLGWFAPNLVRPMWEEGIAVAGAREATRRYALALADWGREHVPEDPRLCELGERVVEAAEGSGLPLFSGWRAEPLPDDGPARLTHVLHLLRELRGGLHLVATTAMGLSPLEAVLAANPPERARFLGWQGDLPDCGHLKKRREEAEELTDRLCAAAYERALSPAERAEFAERVGRTGEAVLGRRPSG
ncbi:MAG TPA: hypothetical protein VIL71_13895 [Spirillospora sp.]